ncbi:MAG: class II fructose-bisphosphate aldolase [Lachnospiraceae bacterium]|nr:class II fructose-bisphosphate aldolase [Lachnospiraceae bacterium]
MLSSLTDVLKMAEEKEIAIGSFNTPNLESLCAVIAAAEELQLPVIVQHAQCHEGLLSLDVIGPIMVEHAKKATVPVCVHLDHGEDLNYLKKALDMGFTSIMYDGSTLPFEENVKATCEAVKLAADYQADVEAEIGSMGQREFGAGEPGADDASKIYTDPDQAREFVERTGIQALACSFGTTHGIYLTKPQLDFGIVKAVREQTGGIPVVMHGGSGVSAEDFRKSILAGVRKVNYFTYMDKAAGTAVYEYLDGIHNKKPLFFSEIRAVGMQAMKENVKEAMRTFARMDA